MNKINEGDLLEREMRSNLPTVLTLYRGAKLEILRARAEVIKAELILAATEN